MLGRQHITISLLTVLPFAIPFIFIQSGLLIFALIFLAAVFAGSNWITPTGESTTAPLI